MALVKLALPPGLVRLGTEYSSPGRWRDANLVRWHEGAMLPLGGWNARITTPITGMGRAIVHWIADDLTRFFAVGTHTNLYAATQSVAAMTDITPVGFTPGDADASTAGGYGAGPYGAGTYGTPRPDTGVLQDASVWTPDNFGQDLVACMAEDGDLYHWPRTGLAVQITNAPIANAALVVTPERFLFALGAGGNKRRVQWADQESLTTWTPASNNQAGDFDLESQARIMGGIRLRSQTMIGTEKEIWSANYIGLPFVYAFDRQGENCGWISRRCAAAADTEMAWMSQAGFFIYDGVARQLDCDVYDAVFRDINLTQRSKINCFYNSFVSEYTWFYPSSSSNEIDRKVIYNRKENHWNMMPWPRLSAFDRGVFTVPMMVGVDGKVYDHETGFTYDGQMPFAESGPIEIGEGEYRGKVRMIIPDQRNVGDLSVSFKIRDFPNAPETTVGPFALSASPTGMRFEARQARMRIDAVQLASWRWGVPRLDVVRGGRSYVQG